MDTLSLMKPMQTRLLRHWGPSVIWALAIMLATTIPIGAPQQPWLPGADKVAHAVMFGVLAALAYRALRKAHRWQPPRAAFSAFLLSAVYGAITEVQQAFVPGRMAEWNDWLADAVGAAMLVIVVALVARRREANRA